MQGEIPLLDQIVKDVVELSEAGGRFDVDEQGTHMVGRSMVNNKVVYRKGSTVHVCWFEIDE